MIQKTLESIHWYEYKLELEKAEDCLNYIRNDKKYPENGARDRFYEFIKINFIENRFALPKRIFWSNILKWETEENSIFYDQFKYDSIMKQIMDTNFDILKMAQRLYEIKPDCKKTYEKDKSCREWYLNAIKNFLRPFVEYEPRLRELNEYIKVKYSKSFEDLDIETNKKIIKEYLFRNKLPVLQITEIPQTQPFIPQTPTPISFKPPVETPKEPQIEIPKEEIKLKEPAKAKFDINYLIIPALTIIALKLIKK